MRSKAEFTIRLQHIPVVGHLNVSVNPFNQLKPSIAVAHARESITLGHVTDQETPEALIGSQVGEIPTFTLSKDIEYSAKRSDAKRT